MKNPTADFRKIPSYWDIVEELPGPPVKVPNRKRSKQDSANNPGIDVAGELFVQNDNINMAQLQIWQRMMRGGRPMPGFMPQGGSPPPPGPPPGRPGGGAG
jgi:hypothetical protein